jgi:hypothetical protein
MPRRRFSLLRQSPWQTEDHLESPEATEADSIAYRTAVMATLQHGTPMPFTDGMGGAVAGRPLRLRFDDRRNLPKPIEKRAWLTPTIL